MLTETKITNYKYRYGGNDDSLNYGHSKLGVYKV